MPDKRPFDPVKASFYLIAFVIVIYAIVILVAVTACFIHAEMIIRTPEIVCDPKNRLNELLSAALAAALAFAGGYMRSPPPPPPPPPPSHRE